LKGDWIHSATYFLGLNQHNYPDNGSNLLGLVFSNIADLSIDHAEYSLVQPDDFHPPVVTDCAVSVRRLQKKLNIFAGDFLLGVMQCFIMPCLLMTGQHCIARHMLMLPLTD
jgi:hypothetical protein